MVLTNTPRRVTKVDGKFRPPLESALRSLVRGKNIEYFRRKSAAVAIGARTNEEFRSAGAVNLFLVAAATTTTTMIEAARPILFKIPHRPRLKAVFKSSPNRDVLVNFPSSFSACYARRSCSNFAACNRLTLSIRAIFSFSFALLLVNLREFL